MGTAPLNGNIIRRVIWRHTQGVSLRLEPRDRELCAVDRLLVVGTCKVISDVSIVSIEGWE